MLIPQVSLGDVTDTMLDGVNTAATGLLIYNTNAAITGGSGVGYYYFNGTQWERLTTSASGGDDDFYEEGTTAAPNAITDDIYTLGNVAIGKNTADWALDVEEDQGGRGVSILMNGTANVTTYGLLSEITNTGDATQVGLLEEFWAMEMESIEGCIPLPMAREVVTITVCIINYLVLERDLKLG